MLRSLLHGFVTLEVSTAFQARHRRGRQLRLADRLRRPRPAHGRLRRRQILVRWVRRSA
nr:hypothetical protein [Angustibacter aerolatus]